MQSEAELKAAESQLRRSEAKQKKAELERKISSQTIQDISIKLDFHNSGHGGYAKTPWG